MKKLLEKTISSREVFHGKFLRVQREDVELPDGSTHYREFIKHPGAAMIIPLFPDNTVLILQQYRHAVKKIFWEFPAGKMDPGESVDKTAVRELQEETGYRASSMKWLTSIHPAIGMSDEHIEIFLATDLVAGPQHLDSGEVLVVQRKSLDELLTMLKAGEISDVKTQIGIFWLEKIVAGLWKF